MNKEVRTAIENIRKNLIETGIYVRTKRDGKFRPIDYINMLPEEVQEENRWDQDGWNKILNEILTYLGGTQDVENDGVTARMIIISIVALLRECNIEGRDKLATNWDDDD